MSPSGVALHVQSQPHTLKRICDGLKAQQFRAADVVMRAAAAAINGRHDGGRSAQEVAGRLGKTKT
jgi:hypothetical protein